MADISPPTRWRLSRYRDLQAAKCFGRIARDLRLSRSASDAKISAVRTLALVRWGCSGQLKGVHSVKTGDACVAVFRVEFLATKAVLI
jgi:hypothetical protein